MVKTEALELTNVAADKYATLKVGRAVIGSGISNQDKSYNGNGGSGGFPGGECPSGCLATGGNGGIGNNGNTGDSRNDQMEMATRSSPSGEVGSSASANGGNGGSHNQGDSSPSYQR